MIEPELARKFIEQVTRYTEYNINIMDESGVIIASRDPKRVGTYHEVAERIIRGSEDMIVIRDDRMFPGVLPGINMAILHEGRKEGVVGVTGDPDKIHEVAMITRMAMEAMLRYEKQQEALRLRRSRKEHLLTLLTQSEFASASEIRGIAGQLGYDEARIRVPILCRIKGQEGAKDPLALPEQALEALRRGRGHCSQDFSFVMDERHLLVFKTVRVEGKRNMVDYREEIREYLDYILQWMKERELIVTFYVGTLQNSFSQYYYSYRHCKWLESHMKKPGEIEFFIDYVREYFRTLTPRPELHRIFNVYGKEMGEERQKQMVEMIGALEASNYNLSETAASIYIHKNTLVYRYNRMKDYLGIDPLDSAKDREFLSLLYLYLGQKN